jgi:hypothetical protein
LGKREHNIQPFEVIPVMESVIFFQPDKDAPFLKEETFRGMKQSMNMMKGKRVEKHPYCPSCGPRKAC